MSAVLRAHTLVTKEVGTDSTCDETTHVTDEYWLAPYHVSYTSPSYDVTYDMWYYAVGATYFAVDISRTSTACATPGNTVTMGWCHDVPPVGSPSSLLRV
jgi:hypothetical protein